jgi:hypothetical protein
VKDGARDKALFRHAARTSIVPSGGAVRPNVVDMREADDRSAILESCSQRYVRSHRVDRIVGALCADILSLPRCAK